nr:MAG TPA: hypothetical protein [Caudoviricetes sp.]
MPKRWKSTPDRFYYHSLNLPWDVHSRLIDYGTNKPQRKGALPTLPDI